MTIDDLIAELNQIREKHGNLPVGGTWEGTVDRDVEIYLTKYKTFRRNDLRVFIDVDGGFYRGDFEWKPV